jgi:predicted ArsR family transcriptional regulator
MTPMNRQSSDPLAHGTRSRLLSLLREGMWTVDDLAARLSLTDNAVRFHIAALEREGSVTKTGVQKPSSAGQPATLYSLTPAAAEAFSRAYAPVLTAVVEELHVTMAGKQLTEFLRRVGDRLAGESPATRVSLQTRVRGASDLLNSLGGITAVEKSGETYRIVGRACPLASAVEADHCVCSIVTSLVSNVVDAEVREQCDRSGRPKCCFEISTGEKKLPKRHRSAG